MSPVISEVKARKKSAFSCEPCRKRKVKCAGEQPSCSRCIVRKEQCIYKLTPTLSYAHHLEARLRDLETALEQAQASHPCSVPSEPVEHHAENSSIGWSTDARGSIIQGSTSFFQPATAYVGVPPSLPTASSEVESRRERLVQNAWEQRSLEIFAETPEPFQYMLSSHWCWIQPLFNFVYRPAFTRDMQTLGPYYSHTLLNAILAHSNRWCQNEPAIRALLQPYDDGNLFSRHARTLLFENIKQGERTIPEVQTLLILSAQECGAGNRAQAWLYSGMAFRLIEDMGICVDNEKYAASVKLTDEDKEIRNRLYWSCYFWDKMISLYLGRSPTLQHTTISPPQVILDDSAEDDTWIPHGISYPVGAEYPRTKSHATSSFMQICSLSVILNQILLHMYDPRHHNTGIERQKCFQEQGAALRNWWDKLPGFLRIEAASLPAHAPPSHIVTLNCLFHTFRILLYRSMLFESPSSPRVFAHETRHLKECIASATSILAIYDLFCKTFGNDRVILSLVYSVYTAASIFLLQVQAATNPDEQALRRLTFCIAALERVKSSTPVLNDALSLLSRELAAVGVNTDSFILPDFNTTASVSIREIPDHAHVEDARQILVGGESISPGLGGFDFSDIEIDPSIFDAFSGLEPISVNVGALDQIQ